MRDGSEPVFLSDRGYRTHVVTLLGGQFYWHVWHRGERVNGGLSESWDDAQQDAAWAARQDLVHRNQLPR